MKPRAPLFFLLSLLLAVGPVGTYAHALQHLGEGRGGAPAAHGASDHALAGWRFLGAHDGHPGQHGPHGHAGHTDPHGAHGDDGDCREHAHHLESHAGTGHPHHHDGSAEGCELFGAHAPMGAGAAAAPLSCAVEDRPVAPVTRAAHARAAQTCLPYFPTGPPPALATV